MYHNAHSVVKMVMVILVFTSVLTWTIFFAKAIQLWRYARQCKLALQQLSKTNTLAEARQQVCRSDFHISTSLLAEIDDEMVCSQQQYDQDFIQRVEDRLTQKMTEWQVKTRYSIGILATIGAVTPFIGLFGTVWGIMNSFIGISNARNVTLSVVAPGIAEALFATALGLVAAIPAVVIYNQFNRQSINFQQQLNRIAAHFFLTLKRDVSLNRLTYKN
ncbi:hypothetical protein A4A71_01770 [Nicoletella semolina]|nr:hypothetical protein [Nicoletella semolina]